MAVFDAGANATAVFASLALGHELSDIVGKHYSLSFDTEYVALPDCKTFRKQLAVWQFDQRQYERIGKGRTSLDRGLEQSRLPWPIAGEGRQDRDRHHRPEAERS